MARAREACGAILVLWCAGTIASASGCSDGVVSETGDAAAGAAGLGGSSGTTGRGGSSGSAGRGGSSGSAGSGGRATGGTSGSNDGGFDLMSCMPVMDEDVCIACARRNCCVELLACGSDERCMRGTDGTNSELGCFLRCMRNEVADGGVASDEAFTRCAMACAVVGAALSPATNELINCLRIGERTDGATGADCMVDCFDDS